MKSIIIPLFLFSTALFGQDTTFYAKNEKVATLDSAEKFNVGQTNKLNNLYLVKYFNYKDKKIILESERYFLDSKLEQQEGISKRFFESGKPLEESFYKEGKLHGRDVSYYKSGKIFYERFYTDGQIDGNFKVYYQNGVIKRDETYKRNTWVSGRMYDSTGVEIPYCGEFEQQPQYPGGIQQLLKYLNKNIKFPKEVARSRGFKGGKVYLTYMLDTDGSIIDVEVVKGLHPACDAEAVRVILGMPKWEPGYQDCKPVKIKFNLPISFLIE